MVTCTVFPGLPHIYSVLPVYRATYNERVGVFLARRSVQHLVCFHHCSLNWYTIAMNFYKKKFYDKIKNCVIQMLRHHKKVLSMGEVTNTVISMVDLTSQKVFSMCEITNTVISRVHLTSQKVFSMCEVTNTVISMVDLTSQKSI